MKKLCLLVGVFVIASVLCPAQTSAQSPVRVIVSASTAPLFVKPDAAIAPLRLANEGLILRVVDSEGEWYRVEFDNPQWGRRNFYIEKRHVNVLVAAPQQEAVDVSVAESRLPAPNTFESPQREIDYEQGKSRARGFFVGVSSEGNGVVLDNNDEADSGAGFGVTIGYGFTPKLALYGQLSGGSVEDADGGYGVGHFDLGLRVHFRAPANTVVPFVQAGLSGRALTRDIYGDNLELSGVGVAFGGGINAHFNPALAFTTGVTWSVGNIGNAKVNGSAVSFDPYGVTSARLHLGIIWFPQSK